MLTKPNRETFLWDVRTKYVAYENVPTLEPVRGIALYGPGAALFTLGPNNTVQQFDLNSPPRLVANVRHPVNLLSLSPVVPLEGSLEEPLEEPLEVQKIPMHVEMVSEIDEEYVGRPVIIAP